MTIMRTMLLAVLSLYWLVSPAGGQSPVVEYDPSDPLAAFAGQEIEAVLQTMPDPAEGFQISLVMEESLGAQGYRITFPGLKEILVEGGDRRGIMYGGLRLAELLQLYGIGSFDEESAAPYLKRRALKMDLTLDARTVGYDDTGDSGQRNLSEVWDYAFWEEHLDEMARHRYNALTLWHPHPFPVMLRLEKYPGVAMDDVLRSTRPWKVTEHPRYAPDDVLDHVEVVKEMGIEDKIRLWQEVMKHARDRGIEVYFITWNIHIDGARGKLGIDTRQDNEKTISYMHDCVEEFVNTYPDLTGLGITAGEMMEDRHDEYSKEKWLWRTYGKGIVDALADEPERRFRFIHRVWETGMQTIMDDFASRFPYDFEVSFKYARGRMYADPNPPFANALLKEIRPHGIKAWWNIRNDDLYTYRWGDPDFARSFIRNIPREQTAGYHMGSDGYPWVKDFYTRDPVFNGQPEIQKHWYNFMMWGRLGYDPGLDRKFFEDRLGDRYPGVPAELLYDAWAQSSRIITWVNRFHWRDWDFLWNYEICSEIYHFHSVDDFIDNPTMEGSGILSIPAYLGIYLDNKPVEGITPAAVVENITGLAEGALEGVRRLRSGGSESIELDHLLTDIELMAHLGLYYAWKISGALDLALFRETRIASYRKQAIGKLTMALHQWKIYGGLASGQYLPQQYARTRSTDFKALEKEVGKDIEIAREAGKKE